MDGPRIWLVAAVRSQKNYTMQVLVILTIVIMAAAPCSADTQPEIAQVEAQLRQAYLKADVAALNELLADEFRVVHVNGREQNKAQFIEALQSGRAKFLSIEMDELEVRDFGNTAVAIARWTNTVEFKGQQNHGTDRVTDVWLKQPAGWRLVSAHASFLEEATPAATGHNALDDEKEILRLEKLLQEAWLKHDTATVGSVVADDLEYWSFKGARRAKGDLLKMVAQNGEATTSVDDPRVRVFGDMAIYTARITDRGKDQQGAPFEATTAVTSIFVRREGKWQMVQDHESVIQK